MSARVLLGPVLVGHLSPAAGPGLGFRFDASYLARPDRPVLGRWFEEHVLDPDRAFPPASGQALPAFFRNALPEGALRTVLTARLRGARLVEHAMLLRLGRDLPGNLLVEADALDEVGDAPETEAPPPPGAPAGDPLRYSLAGVQLKASVLLTEDKVTLPLRGEGGEWIAKFPSPAFRGLPENELTLLRWARAAGLDVPEHRLVAVEAIENLPEEFPREGQALLVRRFDRSPGGGRVHQEDFAQVFGVEPEDKFRAHLPDHVHHFGLGAVIRALCGPEDFREYTRRLAFVVLSGNADADVKNWALLYPDGLRPRLAPVYDFVSAVAYPSLDRDLALGLTAPEHPFHAPGIPLSSVEVRDFRGLAAFAGEPPDEVEEDIRAFVERTRRAWAEVSEGAPAFLREAVAAHLTTVLAR